MRTILGVKINYFSGVLVVFMLIFATSCINDEHIYIAAKSGKGLSLELHIPPTTEVVTRSSAVREELEIKGNSYLIVFNSAGLYFSHELIEDRKIKENTNGTVNPQITFDNIFPNDLPSNAKLVLILNAQFDPILDNTCTYESINKIFTLSNLDLNFGASGIPMYGELQGWNNPARTVIKLKRSVAKLQVQVSSSVIGLYAKNFETPANVKYQIYNYAINGMFKESFAEEVTYSNTNSVPTKTITNSDINRIVPIVGGVDSDILGAVYLCEFPYSTKIIGEITSKDIPINTLDNDRFAVIIKSSHNERYYRLDLCHSAPEYIDIIRNHHYRIVVTEVNSNGYSSANEAFNSPADNIEYDLIDDSGYTTISSGLYAMSIGEESLGGREVVVSEEDNTIEVASSVRWIMPNGANLPDDILNNISVVYNDGKTEVVGVTVSPSVLSKELVPLTFTLTNSVPSGSTIHFKITLGILNYLSEPITIKRI